MSAQILTKDDIVAMLTWQHEMGVDEAILDQPSGGALLCALGHDQPSSILVPSMLKPSLRSCFSQFPGRASSSATFYSMVSSAHAFWRSFACSRLRSLTSRSLKLQP